MIDLETKWWHRLAKVLIWAGTGSVFLLSVMIAWGDRTQYVNSYSLDFESGYTNAPGEIELLQKVSSWSLSDEEIANRLKKFAPAGIRRFNSPNPTGTTAGDLVLAEA